MSEILSHQQSQHSQVQMSFVVQSMLQSQQLASQFEQQTMSQSQVQSQINSDSQIEEMMNTTVESHIQFLRILKETKKTFCIDCTIISKSEISVLLEKAITQANQEFEMNVISKALRAQLRLFRNKLSDIDFDELIMRIADHRFTSLKF
jgi:NCAIR mutase (PurE)-related protein